MTAFQAEGCGGGFAIGHTLSGVRVQRVQKVQRVLRVADCRSAAMLIKSALRDLLSVSYDMLPTRQGSGDSHQRGKTPKWYVKYMTRCFFPSYLSFPLEVAKSFIMPPSAVTSTSSIIIRITTVHPFATSWPSSPKGDARTLRDWLSVSYVTQYPVPPIFSFPLEGNASKRQRVYGAEYR